MRRIGPQVVNKFGLMVLVTIGGKCVVDASYDEEGDLLPALANEAPLFQFFSVDIDPLRPRADTNAIGESLSREQSKPIRSWVYSVPWRDFPQ